MKAVLQVVRSASVECEGKTVSQIGKGFLVLLGVTKQDTQAEADALPDCVCSPTKTAK